jgi:hypothetical protein
MNLDTPVPAKSKPRQMQLQFTDVSRPKKIKESCVLAASSSAASSTPTIRLPVDNVKSKRCTDDAASSKGGRRNMIMSTSSLNIQSSWQKNVAFPQYLAVARNIVVWQINVAFPQELHQPVDLTHWFADTFIPRSSLTSSVFVQRLGRPYTRTGPDSFV